MAWLTHTVVRAVLLICMMLVKDQCITPTLHTVYTYSVCILILGWFSEYFSTNSIVTLTHKAFYKLAEALIHSHGIFLPGEEVVIPIVQ